jgi:2-iminoacetate synthase
VLTPDDLPVLLSPAAGEQLEVMAQRARTLTLQRFGRVVLLYVPLYVSNYCINRCIYCGFNAANRVTRHALTVDEAVKESLLLHAMGFQHLLLVSGEHPRYAGVEYLAAVCEQLRHVFASLCVEVQPLSTDDYTRLIEAGVDCVTCYQETYDPETYARYHQGGPKRDYTHRMQTLERAATAGIRKVGLSPLYGLADWRIEACFAGLHAQFLMRKYWRTQVSISFPRLRHAAGEFRPPHPLPDRGLAQIICALRLALPDAHLVLSTREPAGLRDHLLPLGITQMSAASRTSPHGYSHAFEAECQFDVLDQRSAVEVAAAITRAGYEPVWKDWDEHFLEQAE